MKSVTDHVLNGLNECLKITADEPGSGGASHRYDIIGDNGQMIGAERAPFAGLNIRFQNGPIAKPEDMNGITNESLLAVLIDRMRGFQSGQFACRENAIALTHLEDALMWLQKRTRDRLARGVEGTLKK